MKKFIITEEEKKEILGMYVTKKLIAEQNWTQKEIDIYAKEAKKYREAAKRTTNQNRKQDFTNTAKDLEQKVKNAKENLAKVAREKAEKEKLAREKAEKEKVTNNQVKNNPPTNVKTNDIACKKDTPYNVVTKAGLNWNTVKQAWGSTGTAAENIALRNAVCDGWRPGNPKPGTVSTTGTTETPTTGTTETPTYENVKKTYENQLISAFIDEKKYGAEYKDLGMKDQFFNDYETEYREWLKSKGLLDPTGNVKLEDLTKIYNFLTNLQKR